LNGFENWNLAINDFDYQSKKEKQRKDDVSMDENSFIFYLSPRDAVLSRGVRRLVDKNVKVLKNPSYTLSVPAGLVRVKTNFDSVSDGLVRVNP
jgi:hypothetical protein